ncbi:uncharacterized protein LOC123681667 isoform X1 [Harmonia axyridis]|uniref:uncharacterized protein LOC123681667 isoform X1 n=1 Tax=Harmonia axyridis TaxID=115357 RepID=UPI001E279D2E|nr:uncharacterized protein LOC123681667 isoform X1 [Harmonia axyridis]
MKSLLSDKTNEKHPKAVSHLNSVFQTLFSTVNIDEVQFIPLKCDFGKANPVQLIERGVSLCSVGFEHVGKESHACTSKRQNKITPESSNDSIEDENVVSHPNDNLFDVKRNPRKSTSKNLAIDGILSTQGAPKYGRICEPYLNKYNENTQNRINLKKSVFLIPALLEKIEMRPPSSSKRSKDPNSNISRTDDISWDSILSPVLQGRAEIHPRQSRISQKPTRKKQHERHAEINRQNLNFDRDGATFQHLLGRVEKSSERIVRSITVRSMESVKRISVTNKKLIVKVFEKYLSEVLDCDAKLLLGKKNLALASYEDYLMPTGNMTYFFNIKHPFGTYTFPVLVQDCPAGKRPSITPECGDKQTLQTLMDKKLRCNCKEKNACCHCQQLKAQLTENKRGSSVKDDKTLKNILKPTEMKMSSGCACSQPLSVQKNIEQAAANMEPQASSLVSGNDMKMNRRCNCGRKNSTMQTIGEGEAMTKTCDCAKKSKKKRKSRSRSRSKSRGSKSTKQKCDCTEPCEPKTPVSAEGDQPQNNCACEPDLKNQGEDVVTVCCTPEPPAPSKPRCPCACRELMKSSKQTEDKKACACQPKSKTMKNSTGDDCGLCGDRSELSRGCDADEDMSMSTFGSSDFEKIAGILKDTRDSILNQKGNDKLLSNIRCFRNSSGIICQSEVVGCSTTDDKTGKCTTNTIEIRIKYPNRKSDRSKEKSCACTNTDYTKPVGKRDESLIDEANYCTFVKKLPQKNSCCEAKPTRSDLSMLLDSFARKEPVVCQTTQCVRSNSNVDVDTRRNSRPSGDGRTLSFACCQQTDDVGVCTLRRDSIPCQDSTCAASDTNKKDIKCIFKREKSIDENDSCCPQTKSSDSLDTWAFIDEPENLQTGSCVKESCMRLVKRPTEIVKKRESAVECDVKSSCVRQKIFEKLYPNMKQPCRIPSKKGLTNGTPTKKKPSSSTVRRNSGSRTETTSKKNTPSSSKVALNKSSSKNITANKSKPACSKDNLRAKKRDTMKLDAFDQNILAHALDTFLKREK